METEKKKLLNNIIEILVQKRLLTMEEKNKIRVIVNAGK